ncbi:hypothetical protein [Mucisphaera calidilacus]|uniref:Uncharacterized protein n=1 Tax=Mucisphaera calidilacus TaxID=2527982 RepID=A0A518BZV7_9BACT|nr:hypothetical protein [Mucisphaera calidilacus]QDU72489.1 hypothetical protein Pan265_23550 [Mucisphaera calidilacus]
MRTLTPLALALIMLTLTACSSGDAWRWVPRFNGDIGDNVSEETAFRVGYVPGETYKTLEPLLMTKPEGWNGPIHLVGFSTRPDEPDVLALYEQDPDSFDHFRGTLPAGTLIEITKLVYYDADTEEVDDDDEDKDEKQGEGPDDADHDDDDADEVVVVRPAYVEVRGKVRNGEFEGKTVILDAASREDDFPRDATGYLPDRELMKKVQ